MTKSTYDLLYNRQCNEEMATQNARYLGMQYKDVIRYLEQNDEDMANNLKLADKQTNFETLKNTDVTKLTDEELSSFLEQTSKFRKLFDKYLLQVSKQKMEKATQQH